MMKKRVIPFAFLFLGLFSLNALAASQPTQPPQTRDVFVQTAHEAIITKDKAPNTYKLILWDVGQYTTYFTDRPSRTTSMMPVEDFIGVWHKGFGKGAPNASIAGVNDRLLGKDRFINFAVELTKPQYDAKRHELTYIIHPLQGEEKIPTRIKLSNIALFIDSGVCLRCIN